MRALSTVSLPRNRMLMLGERTLVAGILNVTPDSFYDGSRYYGDPEKAVTMACEMLRQGADILDIGGESSRPGSRPISATEELRRVIPLIRGIRETLSATAVISVDTYKAEVADAALDEGADIVNSLGGMTFDPAIASVVRAHRCPFVIYHIRGTPDSMQTTKIVYRDVVTDIKQFMQTQIDLAVEHGVYRSQFIVDPGIGFGKLMAHNLEIIQRLSEFTDLGAPILISVSRKSHLGLLLKDALNLNTPPPPEERLEASLAETVIAVLNGATIVRTHDVWATRKFLAVIDALSPPS